jgi:Ca2+-binding RTX toxin-like protein
MPDASASIVPAPARSPSTSAAPKTRPQCRRRDDVITAGNGLANLIRLTVDGGAGNDTITGGDGNDVLNGGDGNDVIAAGLGADVASLGTGDDVFIWNQGDGSDVVDGQAGLDTLVFNGAGGSETTTISANVNGATLTRDLGNIVMDPAISSASNSHPWRRQRRGQ